MRKPSVFHLRWLLTVMLVLISACAPSSSMPILVTESEPYPGSVTTPSPPSEIGTSDLVTPSRSIVSETPGPQLRPTIDPLTRDLPVLPIRAKTFLLSDLSTREQAKVYAVVIRRLAGPDDSFAGTLLKPFLFILTNTDDLWGDHAIPTAEPQGISPDLQRAIQDYTTDLSSEIKWVAHREEVKIDSQHQNVIDGVILTLGNIRIGDDQRLYVTGIVFYTYAAAAGQTYVFELLEGQWVLIGRTPESWIA